MELYMKAAGGMALLVTSAQAKGVNVTYFLE
jgi:hypothetical protein